MNVSKKRNKENFPGTNWMWKHSKENLWDILKAVLHATFIVLGTYTKKKYERAQISDLKTQLKNLEKQQTKFKPTRQQDIMKLRAKIDEIEMNEIVQRVNKSKSWFIEEKINKIERQLAQLAKQEKKRDSNTIRNYEGNITKDN